MVPEDLSGPTPVPRALPVPRLRGQDTAEIYPVPTKAETQGRTELALGKWLKTRTRHNVVVATKVTKHLLEVTRSQRGVYLREL